MAYAETVKFLIAMIIMMNPLGSLSIFLQLTQHSPLFYQRQMALKCGMAVCITMLISVWVGGDILNLMGITIPSFRCTGGVILFIVGLSMLQSKETTQDQTSTSANNALRDSVAVVPMALPIIIGPGSISTLVITSNDHASLGEKLWLCLLCLGLASVVGIILYYGSAIAKFLGPAVIKVITRLMGMVIMAIAISMMANGLIGLIPALSVKL